MKKRTHKHTQAHKHKHTYEQTANIQTTNKQKTANKPGPDRRLHYIRIGMCYIIHDTQKFIEINFPIFIFIIFIQQSFACIKKIKTYTIDKSNQFVEFIVREVTTAISIDFTEFVGGFLFQFQHFKFHFT